MLQVFTDAPDLFMAREEPLDDVEDLLGPSYFLVLRNFELNSTALKPAHQQVLRDWVVDFVKIRAGFAELYAMTDRTGSREVNYRVSGSRLSVTQQYLLGLGAQPSKVMHAFAKAIGEDFFEDRFRREPNPAFQDGVNDGQLRALVIALTPAPIGVPTKLFRTRFIAETVAFCRQHRQKA
jgi:hypothetical protein